MKDYVLTLSYTVEASSQMEDLPPLHDNSSVKLNAFLRK